MSNINDQLRELLEEGEKRGFLSYDEILFALTDSALPEEEISKFYDTLQDKGITIVDDNSDDEDEGDLFWQSDDLPETEEKIEFAPKEELAKIAAEELKLSTAAEMIEAQDDKVTPLNLYLADVAAIAPLSAAEEDRLFFKAACGDKSAVEKLIHHSQALVLTVAEEFAGGAIPFLDLVQEGNFGLFDAIMKYDAEFSYRVQAVWWIRYRLRCYVKEEGNIMRIPANIAEDIKKLQKKEHHLHHHLGRDPFDDELAKELEWDTEQVSEIRQMIKNPELLEELLEAEREEEPATEPQQDPDDDYWDDEEDAKPDLLHSMQKRSQSRANQPHHPDRHQH